MPKPYSPNPSPSFAPSSVVVEGDDWVVKGVIACPSLPFNKPGSCYALLEIPEDPMAATGTLTATLKFKVTGYSI